MTVAWRLLKWTLQTLKHHTEKQAQGWQGLKECDQALAGLRKAQATAPGDKAIQAELLKVKQMIKAQKDKEKAVYAKMFA